MNEAGPQISREVARRLLQATAVKAYGRPGVYVARDAVMQQANISDLKEFWAIALHLEEKGWIAEADADYEVFVVTAVSLDEAVN